MHVLIAGCGYVGTALGVRLAARGDRATGLRRDPSGLPDTIDGLAADLDDAESLHTALSSVGPIDAVAVTVSSGGRSVDAYRRSYVDGPRLLLRALAVVGHPVQRVVFTSSSAVWGGEDGVWVDETTPTTPLSATGRVLVEAERALASGPYPASSLRLTGIYGPGRTRLVEQVRSGDATLPPTTTYTNRIHRDDAATAIEHVLDLDRPSPVYAVTDDDPAPRSEVLTWLAERLGVTAPPPGSGRSRPGNKRVSSGLLRSTGWSARYPSFRDGYGEMLSG